MRRHGYLLVCGCVAAGLNVFAAGMQLSAATLRDSFHDRFTPSQTIVNRALKGDRLTARSVTHQPTFTPSPAGSTPAPPQKPRLPDGCEAAVSEIADSPLASTPARCVS